MSKTVIVGGVAGGASAAARLRRLDEHREIVMFERGKFISFANCGMPYYIGRTITRREALTLQSPASFKARFNVDVRVQCEVMALNAPDKSVTVRDLATGETYTESYDTLILSPGAAPIRPPIDGLDSFGVFTVRTLEDTFALKQFIDSETPRAAVVVGGGFIGVEMAENLAELGMEVTIVLNDDHLIPPLDYDMACDLHRHIRDKGVDILFDSAVESVAHNGSVLKLRVNGRELPADLVIMAVGVAPENTLAMQAGLETGLRGAIVVDNRMRTSDPDIFAVGDVVTSRDIVTGSSVYIPLAGPANRQGRVAADVIAGLDSVFDGVQGSSVIKCFDLTAATTGINERTARAAGIDYEKSFTYSAGHATYYPGAEQMSVKLIFEKAGGRLLGAQIVGGGGVDKRCDVLATAIRAGMTVYDLTKLELCYAPPYSSAKDPVNMAGFVAENILKGITEVFHWHDVAELPRDGSVTLLDIRTTGEFARGSIDGFINIPVDSLRDNLGKLDKSKPVYVTCQVGLRGHVACRILAQNGFQCLNLSGGYRLYSGVTSR